MSVAFPEVTPEDHIPADFPADLVDELVAGTLKQHSDKPSEQRAWDSWNQRFMEAGGPDVLTGVQFEVTNIAPKRYDLDTPGGRPSGSLYEIRDVEVKRTTEPRYERTGIPGIFTTAGIFYAGRRAVQQSVNVGTTLYTIDKYNAEGELEDVLVYTREKLMKLAGRADAWGRRDPAERAAEAADARTRETREVHVDTDFSYDDDPFDSISAQLEAQGVFSWDGLSWQEISADGSKVRHVQVEREELLADYHESDKGTRRGSRFESIFTRSLVLKEYGPQGLTVTGEQVLKGPEIRKYFRALTNPKNPEKRVEIYGMRIAAEELPDFAAHGSDTAKELEAELAWDETATLAYMLSYGDVVDASDGPLAEKAIKRMMEAVAKSPEGRERMKALKELIHRHGMDNIYSIAVDLRDQFLESADRLRLPTDFSDPMETRKTYGASISWALESMADRYIHNKSVPDEEYEDIALGDPLDTTNVRGTRGTLLSRRTRHNELTRQMHREIVWEELGWSMVSQTMHKKMEREPVGVDDDGKPVSKVNIGVQFLEFPLTKLPGLTKEQSRKAEEVVYRAVEAKKPPRRADLVALGREMERNINRSPLSRLY